MDSNAEMPKFFKVWNHDCSLRKAVVANSFSDLLKKGKDKLSYKDESVRVVLQCDGTEVRGEDYFSTLTKGTRLLFLRPHEHWSQEYRRGHSGTHDEIDGPSDLPENINISAELSEILHILRHDVTKINILKREELQSLVDMDPNQLGDFLKMSASEVCRIQDTFQRHLDELEDSQEALELLRLLGTAYRQSSPPEGSTGEPTQKRLKPS